MHVDLQPLLLTLKLASVTTVILFLTAIPLSYWMAFSKNRLICLYNMDYLNLQFLN